MYHSHMSKLPKGEAEGRVIHFLRQHQGLTFDIRKLAKNLGVSSWTIKNVRLKNPEQLKLRGPRGNQNQIFVHETDIRDHSGNIAHEGVLTTRPTREKLPRSRPKRRLGISSHLSGDQSTRGK